MGIVQKQPDVQSQFISTKLFLLQLLEKDSFDNVDELRIDGGTGCSVDPVGVGNLSQIFIQC